ncbi:MAG: hypothetical protein MUP45_01815, partial [Candidatus Marinimicrobia bacterium]|nr:hypothetical protein [Candidatus Neomarinimicrobiota bacterium]
MRIRRSRFSKKQDERNLRQAVFYIFLTLGLAASDKRGIQGRISGAGGDRICGLKTPNQMSP